MKKEHFLKIAANWGRLRLSALFCSQPESTPHFLIVALANTFVYQYVKKSIYIAMNCIIVPGVTIGNNVIGGAGAIVTKDVPSDTVVAGVPARKIKSVGEYLVSVQARSLGFGNIPAAEKPQKLKDYFNRNETR